MSKPRVIAFYLPQFYPTPENDAWWQPGFTEWTNVGRAKPLFPGHYQPRVPRDLGYYDLRVPETREAQARLAREAGIEGFCYWHYWFAGRRLLDRVFREVLATGKPDLPFCLCWANHTWLKKVWDPTRPNTVIQEQTYPGEADFRAHFEAMLPAFLDRRYIRVEGRPVFGTFSADFPGFRLFRDTWERLAREHGLPGFFFFSLEDRTPSPGGVTALGYDASAIDYFTIANRIPNRFWHLYWKVVRHYTRIPRTLRYSRYVERTLAAHEASELTLPVLAPNFDHSPRSRHRGGIMTGSTPALWKQLLTGVFQKQGALPHERNIVLVKAWNEWGEGNYMEPDLRYGKGYITAMREAIDETPE